MTFRRVFSVVLVSLITLTLGLGRSTATDHTKNTDPFKIGMLVDRTGFFSWYGEKSLQAAKIVARQWNRKGGIRNRKIEILAYNTKSDPERAIQGARRFLFEAEVDALTGLGFVGAAKAVSPLIRRNGGPVTYSLSGAFKSDHQFMFAGSTDDEAVMKRVLKESETRGWHRLALLTPNNATGQSAIDSARKLVGSMSVALVKTQLFNPESVDVTAQLSSIRSHDPDVLFAWVIGKPMFVVLNNYRQLGMKLPLVTVHANLAPRFIRRLQSFSPRSLFMPATKDIVWKDLPDDDPTKPPNRSFHRAWYRNHDEWPGLGGGTARDAVTLLLKAIQSVGSHPRAMVRYLEQVQDFAGVVGTYRFSPTDHRGLGEDDVVLTRVRDGKIELISSSNERGR